MKIDFKKILNSITAAIFSAKKILWFIGRHAFMVILILVLLDILYGGFLFFKYIYSTENQNPQINLTSIKFNTDSYQKILSQWQERDQKIQQFLQKDYPNPF